ncbi:hypothetical protein ACFPN2_08115 [Steroidobacter flavus]|uniref:Outer membrane protein beta-barrel domain-containing protein n=1 Tax=Steroidobacter flavus TaxID=1842136 RepID=A0ABV8SNP9_9GAMM
MRNLVVAAGLALFASGAMAADFGVGVSAKSDDGVIYVPIDFSDKFRLEPSLRYYKEERNDDPGFDSESDLLELGVGVFGKSKVTEAAQIYYGGRITYFDGSSKTGSSKTTVDGYGIAPTFGVEYVFGGHFSLGGEVAYAFEKTDSEDNSFFSNDIENETQGTQTRLIFRFMF